MKLLPEIILSIFRKEQKAEPRRSPRLAAKTAPKAEQATPEAEVIASESRLSKFKQTIIDFKDSAVETSKNGFNYVAEKSINAFNAAKEKVNGFFSACYNAASKLFSKKLVPAQTADKNASEQTAQKKSEKVMPLRRSPRFTPAAIHALSTAPAVALDTVDSPRRSARLAAK
jgi:hypothetical protein